MGVIAVVESLDLTAHAMRAAGEFMAAARDQSSDDRDERVRRLVEVLKEEKDKIQVFQRELPFTMQILTDVMEGFRREVERRQRQEEERLKELSLAQVMKPVVKLEKESLSEKNDWLSSAQLWVDNPSSSNATASREKSSDHEGGEKWTSNHQPKLMPFPSQWSIGRGMNGERQQQEEEQRVSKLTIAVAGFTRMPPPPAMSAGSSGPVVAYRGADNGFDSVSPVTVSTGGSIGLQVPSQQHRKARRCWSPELHRLFVSALNQLGGAQVATPKQIRELMKVDGLTNDEVKSHLQKYRLHNRRVPNGITAVSGNRPMGLMDALLGTTSEHGTASSQQSISQSASPKDMHQFTASGRTASTNAGDSCEEEDVKSESYNWK